MALFRRKQDERAQAEEELDDLEVEAPADPSEGPTGPVRTTGPYDAADAPDDDVQRVDLGSLLVPVPTGTEVRVDVSKEGAVIAATLVRDGSSVQVTAFAAPRSEGIWDDVLEEIAGSLTGGGGQADRVEGPYGPELLATVPTQAPGGAVAMVPARFAGVDGPRWFLRALFTGPAARDSAAAEPLERALRDVVVVRGTDPMAVRDPLPLRLPPGAQQVPRAAGAPQAPADPLALQERGPEITETR